MQHTEIGARTPDGEVAGMRRWVLQEQVWVKLLDEAGFPRISTQTLPGGTGPRAAHALLVDRVPHGPVRRVAPRCGHWQSGHACYGSQ
ncbi:hypothetical protein AB0E06_33390 [Streptomyces sp. NPDC048109]|uniref:hypothetical protein n=1 Tax=Streptomyces sp. NPDC048109 TaxID=3155482 RepID=UPI00341DF439